MHRVPRHLHQRAIDDLIAEQPEAAATLPGPDLPERLAPLALIVPGQLLVEALAHRLGLDPDHPRGLTKVTQTGGAQPSPAAQRSSPAGHNPAVQPS